MPVFSVEGEKDPVRVAKLSLSAAGDHDVILFDTAGRLHIDEELMGQLEEIKKVVRPQDIIFVASSNTGQDAVKTAAEFDRRLSITGTILTMLDGSSRAGAAISIREVTGKPLLFEGIGEKIGDLQPFNPRSMADRILGMGDVVNLVRKAEEHYDEAQAEALEKKMRKAAFTYSDYLSQMGMMKKMGSFKSLLQMLPGGIQIPDIEKSEGEFKRMEAMIHSMTLKSAKTSRNHPSAPLAHCERQRNEDRRCQPPHQKL